MGRERSKSRRRRVATPTKDRGQLTENIVTARRDLRAKFYSRVRVHCISVAWKQYCVQFMHATDMALLGVFKMFPNTALCDLIAVQ